MIKKQREALLKVNARILLITAALLIILSSLFVKFFGSDSSTVKPKISPVVEAVYSLGTVKSVNSVNVRFGMNSVINRFYVSEGESVSKGALLLVTDSAITFRSPISGIITSKNFNESEIVPSGQVVLTVTDMKSLYIRLSLDQESVTAVRKGMKTEISFENLRERKIAGEVESVYQSGGEFVVRIKVPVMPEMVLPEMTCDTAIIIRQKPDAILIPASAVVNDSVMIKRNSKKEMVKVKIRPVENGWVEVLDGGIGPEDNIYLNNPEKAGKNNFRNSSERR